MDADVHEHAEIDDIADGAGEHHARLQVLQLQHVSAQDRGRQIVAHVPSGLHQLLHRVMQGGQAHAQLLRRLLLAQQLYFLGQQGNVAVLHVLQRVAAQGQQLLRRTVALGMDAGVVQYGSALRHPQEAGALLKGLGPQLRHLQKPLPVGECAVLLAVLHNILRRGGGKTGHTAQKTGGRGVHVHTHGVDAVLHHAGQRLVQPLLGHIVLVLAHADGLGIDLHQLRQRVLHPPRDRYGAAQVHIVVGELLRCQLAGGVHGGSRLVDDHIADPGQAAEHLHRHLLRLAAGGAVADGDVGDAVLFAQGRQLGDGVLFLALTVGGIDHGGVQHLAGAVDDRHLAAVGIAGVQAHGDVALHRRLHQKGLQVQGKLADSALAGGIGQGRAGLPLQRGVDEPVVGVLAGGADERRRRCAGLDHCRAQRVQRRLPIQQHRHGEEALLFAPVDGQDLVPRQPGQRLIEVVVQPVHAVLLLDSHAAQVPLPRQEAAQRLAQVGVVAEQLGDDVVGALQGIGHGLHALFRVEVGLGGLLRCGAVLRLGQQQQRQGLQPLLTGGSGAGAPLLLIGAVQILYLRQRGGVVDGGGQLLRQLALPVDGGLHLLPPRLQIPQIAQPVLQLPQGGVVHGAVLLLAVAGNEGDGVALIQQGDDVFHGLLGLVQLLGQYLGNGLHEGSFQNTRVSVRE